MKNNPFPRTALTIATGLPAAATDFNPPAETGQKDYDKSYFPIGVAVAPRNLTDPEAELIVREFNL